MSRISPVTVNAMRKFLHAIANGLMPLTGTVSLMRLRKLPADDVQLEKLELALDKLCKIVADARGTLSSDCENATQTLSSEVFEITYLSRRSVCGHGASDVRQELNDIRSVSEKNNSKNGIGGFLLYFDGFYLQRLEGVEEKVKSLMSKILLDERHQQVTVLSQGRLENSTYKKWRAMYCMDATQDAEIGNMVAHISDPSRHSLRSSGALSVLNLLVSNMEKRALL